MNTTVEQRCCLIYLYYLKNSFSESTSLMVDNNILADIFREHLNDLDLVNLTCPTMGESNYIVKEELKIYLTKEGKEYVESLSGSEIIDTLYNSKTFLEWIYYFPDDIFLTIRQLHIKKLLTASDINFILSYDYEDDRVLSYLLPNLMEFIKLDG